MRITVNDARAAGHCARGMKAWFETHGLDFRAFLEEGIEEEEFLAKGDALAVRVVELAHERRGAL